MVLPQIHRCLRPDHPSGREFSSLFLTSAPYLGSIKQKSYARNDAAIGVLRRQVVIGQPGDLSQPKPQILQRQDAMESGQRADRVVYGWQKEEEAREDGGHGDFLR